MQDFKGAGKLKALIPAALMVSLLILIFIPGIVSACTIIGITPGASEDGSVYAGHTNDGIGKDWRNIYDVVVTYIPPADHKSGSERPVFFAPNSGSDAVDGGRKDNLTKMTVLGYIDEVPHTYGYYTSSYGMINEKNLMSAECTDHVKYEPDAEINKRIFYSSDLSNVALERCTNARDAVLLVGDLIDSYGYYGTGETLLFADSKEVWVIEMCGNPVGDTGGLWVAKKVTDGEIFIAGNEFRIREVKSGTPDMYYSENLFDATKEAGWWDPSEGTFDWLKAVSYGEYAHPYYSLMRVWRLTDKLAPSLNLSPYVENSYTKAYPFSFKPDEKVDFETALNIFRDHYEGTEFDLTKGKAAGPFGNPYRYVGPVDSHRAFQNETSMEIRPGANVRPVSAIFCSFSYIAQIRTNLPDETAGILWFGPAVPSETVYAPIYANSGNVSPSYSEGSRMNYNYDMAYWTFDLLTNWAMLKYNAMIGDIQDEQRSLEEGSYSMLRQTDAKAAEFLNKGDYNGAKAVMTNFTVQRGDEIINEWKALTGTLIVKYSNGLVTDPVTEEVTESGYPDWWYDDTDYQYGPRVYQLDELRETPGLNYTGKIVSVPKDASFEEIKEVI
ncbi:dipeptidase [Methanoplanus endosymbiosus]|uniref:C69 family dipeptidase n=1 Tax=Methanoplanus endosymbiosus TaxID=33865 RepID=A0A9E7PNI8_9EURY|nr:C69 family dipeptidase [Methanoplanus endosymbiosus]UUX92582.1 C69 family dipeptidase [Methanoplanus endosymbiosus]